MEQHIGLQRGTVKVTPYNTEWPRLFEEERANLLKVIGNVAIKVKHTGSTSIPGMPSKPIIDILVAVKSLNDVEEVREKLIKMGYDDRGNAGVEGRRFFAKGPEENRTHHLSFTEMNGEMWTSHTLFCDYLKKHPEVAAEYAELKKELSEKYSNDRGAYTESKVEFVRKVINKAKQEQDKF